MNKNPVPLHPIAEVIGEEAFAKLKAELGGKQFYVPTPLASAAGNPIRMPALCLRGTFVNDVAMNEAALTVAGAAVAMHEHGVRHLVLEVETAGIGAAYLDCLIEALAPHGIDVRPMALPL